MPGIQALGVLFWLAISFHPSTKTHNEKLCEIAQIPLRCRGKQVSPEPSLVALFNRVSANASDKYLHFIPKIKVTVFPWRFPLATWVCTLWQIKKQRKYLWKVSRKCSAKLHSVALISFCKTYLNGQVYNFKCLMKNFAF